MSKTIYVFKDKDGDYLVANAAVPTDGTIGYQLKGSAVDGNGGDAVTFLEAMPSIILLMQACTLKDITDGATVEAQAAHFGNELIATVELDADSKLAQFL